MIYFPFPDFEKSCAHLDIKARKKQIVEVGRALRDLQGIFSLFRRTLKEPPKHVQAWRGYERALARYAEVLWDSMKDKVKFRGEVRAYLEDCRKASQFFESDEDRMPSWWGNPIVHESHQKALEANDKKLIVWPVLPDYPRIRNHDELVVAEEELKAVDPTTLSPADLRAYRLKQNAVTRYRWS
jgi:hypothetical protein